MSNTATLSVEIKPWIETTLGELAEYITSGSRDWSKYYADSGAIFIRTQDINRNRLSLNEVAFVKLPEKVEGKRSLVRKGDLLVTITGANVGKVAMVEGEIPEAYVSQSVCLVRLKDPSLAKFVHLQLTAKRGDKTTVEAMAYGLGRPVLNLENIRSAPIRVAPTKARVVIVAEIEKQFSRLDEAVANLKRVKANLKRYKAAVLKAAVEGKLTEDWRKQHFDIEPASKLLERILAERRKKRNGRGKYEEPSAPEPRDLPSLPKGWMWATVEQLSMLVQYGSSAKTHEEAVGVPVLRMGNIEDARLRVDSLKYLPENHTEFPGLFLQEGDILFNRTNSAELVGKTAMYKGKPDPCSFASYLIRVRLVQGCAPDFLTYFINSVFGRAWIAQVVSQQVGQANVNGRKLQALAVPLPPLAEQRQIVAEAERRLSVIDELETAVQANLTRADRLRQSILSEAFSNGLNLERSSNDGLAKGVSNNHQKSQ